MHLTERQLSTEWLLCQPGLLSVHGSSVTYTVLVKFARNLRVYRFQKWLQYFRAPLISRWSLFAHLVWPSGFNRSDVLPAQSLGLCPISPPSISLGLKANMKENKTNEQNWMGPKPTAFLNVAGSEGQGRDSLSDFSEEILFFVQVSNLISLVSGHMCYSLPLPLWHSSSLGKPRDCLDWVQMLIYVNTSRQTTIHYNTSTL